MTVTPQTETARHHLIAMLVENKAGVLVRVAGLFTRRGFNIFSLAVAPTADERFSRIVAVVDVQSAPLQQILEQLDKLVNVVEITELRPADAVEAELLLATVSSDQASATQIGELVIRHGGRVVDQSSSQLTLMLAGAPDQLDQLEDELRTHGIVELQRSGRIALRKLA